MTNVYSANLFALLGDDGDAAPVPKPAPKPVAAEPAVKSQKEKTEQRTERSERGGERGRGGRRGDGERGRGGYRGGRDGEYKPRPRRNEDGTEVQRAPRFQEATEDGFERKESSYKPRGNRRGGPPGRGAFRGHREFDRQSGNNWDDSEKKEVAGKGTWGDAVESQVVEIEEAKAEEAVKWAPDGETEAAPAEEAKEIKPEEPVGKTLAEYQAELAAKRASLAAAPVRTTAENDDSKWAASVKLTRTEDNEAIFVGKEKVKKEKVKERPVKVAVEIEQRFSDEGRRGGFGGRGRGRGGNGFGRGDRKERAPRGKQPAVNLHDESAFPSLSK